MYSYNAVPKKNTARTRRSVLGITDLKLRDHG
jgi:hypothetical protein